MSLAMHVACGEDVWPGQSEGTFKFSPTTERAFKLEEEADFVAWYSLDGKLDVGVGRTDKKENLYHSIKFSLEELEGFFDKQKHKNLIVVGIQKQNLTKEVLEMHITKLRDYFVARGYARVVIQQAYGNGRGIHLEHVANPNDAAAPSDGDKLPK